MFIQQVNFKSNMKKTKFIIIIYMVLVGFKLTSQSWEREYGSQNRNDLIIASVSYYDNGLILGLRVDDNKVWIIKTDINGYVLWSKIFYHTQKISIYALAASEYGEIVFTGMYRGFDEQGDSYLLKLDSCGNQDWCKVSHKEDFNYGREVLYSFDGNIIWHTFGGVDNYIYNRIWKIDNEGFSIWNKVIASRYVHPFIHSPVFENMYETSDNGLILSGSCYYQADTNNPSGNYKLRSLLLKTDESGNEEWLLPAGYEEEISGCVDDVLEHGNSYYAVGYRYDTSSQFTSPLFLKVSNSGELLYHTVINQGDTLENYLIGIRGINDSSLILAGRTRRGEDSLKMGIFKTDTLGNIITWMENNNGSPIKHCIAKTQDNKFLVTGYSVHGDNYQGYAVKVNENIEFDSLYTYPFNYDSLCPDTIVSDTIFCDCDILVGREEVEAKKKEGKIMIYPNPATSKFIIRCSIFNIQKNTVEIFDLFGRKIKQIKVAQGSNEIEVDVSGWQRGLYFVKVNSENGFTESAKVILE